MSPPFASSQPTLPGFAPLGVCLRCSVNSRACHGWVRVNKHRDPSLSPAVQTDKMAKDDHIPATRCAIVYPSAESATWVVENIGAEMTYQLFPMQAADPDRSHSPRAVSCQPLRPERKTATPPLDEYRLRSDKSESSVADRNAQSKRRRITVVSTEHSLNGMGGGGSRSLVSDSDSSKATSVQPGSGRDPLCPTDPPSPSGKRKGLIRANLRLSGRATS